MRLLTLLATTVLLAACVHDTDDFNLFLAERGVSLTYYIGSDSGAHQKNHDDPWDIIGVNYGVDSVHAGKKKNGRTEEHDDPWDTISEKFGVETVHTGKSGHDDPWDVIGQSFPLESVHTSKSGEEDPWNRINELFPAESVYSGKTNDRLYFGVEKSRAVFLSFSYLLPTTYRAQVMEVRGRVAKLEFADGVEQYVIDAPASWTKGVQLETGFVGSTTKKDRPFLGVRFWRTVEGNAWGSQSRNLASELPAAWPSEHDASGASLLVSLSVGQKSYDDPWDTIRDNFSEESTHTGSGKSHDDPWDEVMTNFSEDSVHTGSDKSHDDPWERIGERKASFRGRAISEMLFVTLQRGDDKMDDPWDVIQEKFPTESISSTVLLKLIEVRGEIGRFCSVSSSGGDLVAGHSIFAVGIPAEWETGLLLRGEAYLLDTKKMLPLIPRSGSASSGPLEAMGAVTWEVEPILR